MNLRAFSFLPVLALAGVTAGCDDMDFDMGGTRVEAPFHYSYDIQPGGRVELETFNGSIEVRSWDQNKVDVSGTKYANSATLRDAIKIDASAGPADVTIRAVRPSDHHGNMGAKFVVRVPKSVTLSRLVSSNGAINVDDTSGPVKARSSNGSLHLTHLRGELDAQTSNGAIEVSELTGNAVLHTSNGHIQADHVTGQVNAESSNGSITVAFEAPPRNDVHLTTSNSSIDVTMPSTSAVRLRASTSNSSISSDFDVSSQGTLSKTHLEGSVNGGGPLLDLSTSNGSIKISKR